MEIHAHGMLVYNKLQATGYKVVVCRRSWSCLQACKLAFGENVVSCHMSLFGTPNKLCEERKCHQRRQRAKYSTEVREK